MKFCDRCGTRLKLKKIKSESGVMVALQCDRCGSTTTANEPLAISETESLTDQIKVVTEEMNMKPMPTIEEECPRCGNKEAFWWLLQTRGGDEPTTQFYRCTKCNHTWRQYA